MGRAWLAARLLLHGQKGRGWRWKCLTPSISLANKQTCPKGHVLPSQLQPSPQLNKHTVWGGFGGFQRPSGPHLGCAPILSKHSKDTTKALCLSGSTSQSDKNWNKTPKQRQRKEGKDAVRPKGRRMWVLLGLIVFFLALWGGMLLGLLLSFGLLLTFYF